MSQDPEVGNFHSDINRTELLLANLQKHEGLLSLASSIPFIPHILYEDSQHHLS